jgi:hypothetical protein
MFEYTLSITDLTRLVKKTTRNTWRDVIKNNPEVFRTVLIKKSNYYKTVQTEKELKILYQNHKKNNKILGGVNGYMKRNIA